jgi:hypothetical protein
MLLEGDMTLKEVLDKLTQIIRAVQYANNSMENMSNEEIVSQLHSFLILVGQALAERDEAEEVLQDFSSRLWMSHVHGSLDCPTCQNNIPVDFYVGSKGISGVPVAAGTKDELMQRLEFPPITMGDLADHPIPDYLPDQI